MALEVEGVVDGSVHAQKALGGFGRFEALQLALASSHHLMRGLRPIVHSEPLFVRAGQPQSPERRGIRAQLVGHQQFRCKALLFEKLAHQPQRRPAVAAALNQHVEHLALVIDGSPEIHPLAGDPHHHLVQMPSVAWPRATSAQPSGDHRSELQHPTPHRFVREVEPTLGEQILHVAVAQGEAKVEPNRVLDNRRRKPMAAIREQGHGERLSDSTVRAHPVSVTMPFVAVLAPGWLDHFIFNEYNKTEEEFLFALADALREEYRAVVAAGFVLQIDDPGLPDWWDMLKPEPTTEAYRKFARLRIDAVNHALVGIPEEKVRYHLCWGSWHGPHTHDLPLEHIIDLILEVKAQTYSFEAGNVRHEHEWRVWQQAKLPPGKMLMPGVVSHATNLVEHPQLVADRILRYTAIVGCANVIAGTDCGLGGRVHGPRLGQAADTCRRRPPSVGLPLALV